LITRSAIFEGEFETGSEQEFFAGVVARLVPIWRKMPNAVGLRVYRPIHRDDGAPRIVLIQETDYPSAEAFDVAMESPLRVEARAITGDLLKSFKGRVYHVVSERSDFAPV
jgi:hypothetical protein